jgi:hypothetical protein
MFRYFEEGILAREALGSAKREPCIDRNELGWLMFPLAKPTYRNISMVVPLESDGVKHLLWCINTEEVRDYYKWAIFILSSKRCKPGLPSFYVGLLEKNEWERSMVSPDELRMDVYIEKQTGNLDFGETYIKTREGDFVLYDLVLKNSYLRAAQVFFRVLSVINCRNIVLERNDPDERRQKKRERKGKKPLFSYYTLRIKRRESYRADAQQKTGLWDNRLHLCRGHFKTYTTEKPLFGSVTGTFWWQPCVRGRSRNGIVLKDYELEEEDTRTEQRYT